MGLRYRRLSTMAILTITIVALAFAVLAEPEDGNSMLAKADELFDKKNYKEASELYEKLTGITPRHDKWHHASNRVVICRLRLQLFDLAIEAVEKYVELCKDTPHEARAERLAGNLYMLIPHWGTRAGGKFHRAQYKQGIRLRSNQYDKKHALAHMERARELYKKYDGDQEALSILPDEERKGWHNERIECIFDLAAICARFGIYEGEWHYWYSYWGERDDFTAETAGEKDFDEYYSNWQLRRKRPIGLRVGKDGKPIFPAAPEKYASELDDDKKILFLLKEARDLDKTENGDYTALSYYRQAMLSRSRFGMDRLNSYSSIYRVGGVAPLKEELETFNPWELGDGEAIVLAGGKIRRVALPEEWNVIPLLRVVAGDYARAPVASEAQYCIALYHQSRQQYKMAIEQYNKVKANFAESQWSKQADRQIGLIKQKQVLISQAGVQLPDEPAKLQLSFRNTSKVWFVARKIDYKGFMEELRNERIDKFKGLRGMWLLPNWHHYFVYPYDNSEYYAWIKEMAAKYVGKEIARWADEVPDDGSHRYAHKTLQTPLKERGGYLIYAYTSEPPKEHAEKTDIDLLALGESRAVFVLTDLAFVEKHTKDGTLYFVCDARSGKPVPGAEVQVLHVWSVWDRNIRKSIHYKKIYDLETNEDGIAQLTKVDTNQGNLHLLVKAQGDRVAWSGMTYWSRYRPSRMQQGVFAFCITDRPVYRPKQTVHYKVWVRNMQNGILNNMPGKGVSLTVYDPRGNKVHTDTAQADQYGGIDGEFTLGEEPTLGVYRIYISGRNYLGGQNFRVEEYKKPEFEVAVEPGKTHVKLGDKLTAVVKAKYYFGGPVVDATVDYKVFREEYTHAYYFPGEWDWLYGQGYGWAWYEYSWMPWWGRVKCCWIPPGWWWGGFGGSAPNPVRELVMQGKEQIGEDGSLKLEIDTSPALRDHSDRDHRYIVQADVRDSSRRVISGQGAVKVTRQAYYTFIQADRGYYRPGDEIVVRVSCLTPGYAPVKTEGVVTVSSVVYGGPENARIEETELKRWKASTDERGKLEFRLRHEKSGLLKFKFASPDEWGGVVEGYALVWVAGRDFDGKLYRFNNLEIITDKRSYQPGETAHVMINTKHADSYVLYSDEVDNNCMLSWKLLHLPKKHMVVDIPIKREHHPNFFIEATTVADTRVHQQSKRICVPPEEGIIKLAVETDKVEYKPGEKATVKVTAKTLDGKPAQTQVVLSAFDKSVLYIQPEMTPPIAKFFHGNLRYHYANMLTNLHDQFSSWGYIHRPFQHLSPYPSAWFGIWGVSVGDWRAITDGDMNGISGKPQGASINGLGKGGGRAGGYGGKMEEGESKSKEMSRAASPGAPAPAGERMDKSNDAEGDGGGDFAEAQVRQKFADTALWQSALVTDLDGTATVTFDMPENLTTWKINAWGMTTETKVGENSTSAVTTKNLLVRLQAPRFFMEYDEVVISANVHNYLEKEKTARVTLDVPEEYLKMIGETPKTVDVKVAADGETRVDWRVKVIKEGTAKITVTALTDEESDAMQMTFPVLVHGMIKQVASTGSMKPDEKEKTITVELEVPEKRRPEFTRLEVQYAPSLVGAMMDALPYLIYYPYGCTEQTMSRFMPCVLTLKTLQNMGIKLEDVKKIRGRMEEIRKIEKGEHVSVYWNNPIFDGDELDKMIKKGLARITNMQNGDGGWGWWSTDRPSPYLTCYVLFALCTAQESDLKVDQNMINRGMNYLRNQEISAMRNEHWSVSAQHAFAAYVLSMKKVKAEYKVPQKDKRSGSLIERLYSGRDKLNLYGKALLALALANLDDTDRAKTVLQNIMQYKEENEETQVAWFRTPARGWWYWWNSDIETNAWILRAITKLDPKSDVAPRLVKWLLNNRRNGYYWRSTRDTTMCLAALSDFVVASGEGQPDYTLTLDFDNGAVVKKVKINKDNFFTYDNRFLLEGVTLGGGKHTLKVTKEGAGALYFNTYLRYFTKEEHITAAGHELKVDRTYFKLVQIPYEVEVEGAEGQKLKEKRLRYERVPVKNGDELKSGDVIQVELKVKSDNDYTYVCFEDMKPAGCEPLQMRSGSKGQEGFCSYMELRDEKVVFFVSSLGQGEHLLRYRLRAEVPGVFHALPTSLFGMYVPELRANSEEILIKISD